MKWVLLIIVVITLCGPLRLWLARHWAFLLSVTGGALFGLFLAGYLMRQLGCSEPMLPLILSISSAIWAGRYGPSMIRRIERDGQDGSSS